MTNLRRAFPTYAEAISALESLQARNASLAGQVATKKITITALRQRTEMLNRALLFYRRKYGERTP